jgi:hypothetical protein
VRLPPGLADFLMPAIGRTVSWGGTLLPVPR